MKSRFVKAITSYTGICFIGGFVGGVYGASSCRAQCATNNASRIKPETGNRIISSVRAPQTLFNQNNPGQTHALNQPLSNHMNAPTPNNR